jgi:hypothetical protein
MSPGPDYIEPVGILEYPDLFVSYESKQVAIKKIEEHLHKFFHKPKYDRIVYLLAIFECIRRNIHFLSWNQTFVKSLCKRLNTLEDEFKQFNEPLCTFYESFFQQFLE